MENSTTPFQASIKTGLITGLILTVINFICYFIDYKLLGTGWLGFVSLAIYCGLIIYFGIQYRSALGGFMSFGEAYRFSFFSLFIMLVVVTFSNMLLYLVLDPTLGEKMADIGLENTLKLMDSIGAGDISSDQMDEIKNGLLEGFSPLGLLRGAGIMLIFYAILSLILGAIIKKKDKSLDY